MTKHQVQDTQQHQAPNASARADAIPAPADSASPRPNAFLVLAASAFCLYALNVVLPILVRYEPCANLWSHTLQAMPAIAGSALGAAILSILFGGTFILASMALLRPKKTKVHESQAHSSDTDWPLIISVSLFGLWLLSYLTLHMFSGPYETLSGAHRFGIRALCFPVASIIGYVSAAIAARRHGQ